MKKKNIFYLKEIVDKELPSENKTVDTKSVIDKVKIQIQTLSDDDFIEILIACFIPDLYKDQGKREKLFTKLSELLVGEWWRRLGGTFHLPTKKSGTEDVELIYHNVSVVCDTKVFRLGRSQKAPNVKDFLKLASVATWISNLKKRYMNHNEQHEVIGGLITYSSLHEWENDSEVYEECTNHKTPVIMFPYEILALLLKYKNIVEIENFLKIWDYEANEIETSREKKKYWNNINHFLINLLGIDKTVYYKEITYYHKEIIKAAKEYRKLITNEIETVKASIEDSINTMTNIEDLRKYTIIEIEKRENAQKYDYLKHIDAYRKYFDKQV